MENKKSRLEIFKYNAILSALFFLASTLYLGGQVSKFNFFNHTISQMSFFLNPQQLSFFNLLFFIKCLLDLSFTSYVFKKFQLKIYQTSAIIWLLAILSFGLIGFFPESQYLVIHWIIAGGLFLFGTTSEYLLAKITKSENFVYLSNNIIVVQIALMIISFALNQINAIFEIIYFLLFFFWQIIFISRYL